ncbi:16S rRNA (adenine(1518)-N(6)/adenine(1519)-N(6))-dimethyltransferase RsmA [Myxococcota bacterium]|nr:16S rRNA (adenine(1518)-N(6)/adenine(1519)-N(6))-dimethyltransferase RsmA [Myxococcota bacterium]
MSTRAEIRALLEEHGLRLKRALGQSFLVEDHALARIADAATSGGEATVVEIGTGLGTLTRQLAKRAAKVVTIERDHTLVPVLRELFAPITNVTIVEADALDVSFAELGGPDRPAVAGNIPYSITTPILLALLGQRAAIGTVTLMMQREVAARLVAKPDTREYGSLTVLFRQHADIVELFDVGPGNFLPPPKVVSTVLQLRWLPAPRVAIDDAAHFERTVRAAFGQRRKTLRNALSALFARSDVEAAGAASGIELVRRAETLTLEELARLASALPRSPSTSSSPPSEE